MKPNNPAVKDASRITISFWTSGAYVPGDADDLLEAVTEAATNFDDDIIPGSFEIDHQDHDGIIAANRSKLVDMLAHAEATTSLRFGEDVDDLVYAVGGDNE